MEQAVNDLFPIIKKTNHYVIAYYFIPKKLGISEVHTSLINW